MEFPDIENVLRLFLEEQLDGVIVKTRVPNKRPASFIRVWRTGGAARNRVLDEPLITVECWGDDDSVSVPLAYAARDAILHHSNLIPLVRAVEDRSGIYYDPDPVSGTSRYTFTVEMRVRAAR